MDTQLVKYDDARRALSVAHSVDEAKDIEDKAAALKAYARQTNDTDMEIWAAEIRTRARIRIGELSTALDKSRGGSNPQSTLPAGGTSKSQALKEAGLSKSSANRCEALSEISPEIIEACAAAARESKKPLTSDQIMKAAKAAERKKKQKDKESNASNGVSKTDWAITDKQDVIECAAVITDPPYGILDEEWEPHHLESFTTEWAHRWNECGADTFLIFWSQRYLWNRDWFDRHLTNYHFQQLLVWHYPNNKSPQSRRGFKQTWEPIFFYRRNGSDRKVGVGGSEWGEGLNDFDAHVAAVPQSNFNDAEMKQHPAQKPVSVFRWLINAVTEPGEIVADPFAGSGTSGIAAVQLNRRWHGIEIDRDYRKIAKGRISSYGV